MRTHRWPSALTLGCLPLLQLLLGPAPLLAEDRPGDSQESIWAKARRQDPGLWLELESNLRDGKDPDITGECLVFYDRARVCDTLRRVYASAFPDKTRAAVGVVVGWLKEPSLYWMIQETLHSVDDEAQLAAMSAAWRTGDRQLSMTLATMMASGLTDNLMDRAVSSLNVFDSIALAEILESVWRTESKSRRLTDEKLADLLMECAASGVRFSPEEIDALRFGGGQDDEVRRAALRIAYLYPQPSYEEFLLKCQGQLQPGTSDCWAQVCSAIARIQEMKQEVPSGNLHVCSSMLSTPPRQIKLLQETPAVAEDASEALEETISAGRLVPERARRQGLGGDRPAPPPGRESELEYASWVALSLCLLATAILLGSARGALRMR